MIQNSINQMLGVAGLAGGAVAKLRTDIINSRLDEFQRNADTFATETANNAKNEQELQAAEMFSKQQYDKMAAENKSLFNPVGVNRRINEMTANAGFTEKTRGIMSSKFNQKRLAEGRSMPSYDQDTIMQALHKDILNRANQVSAFENWKNTLTKGE